MSDIHYKLLALAFILAILVVAAVNSMNQSRDLAGSSVDDANNATAALKNISLSIQEMSNMVSQISNAASEQRSVTEEVGK
ncbi:hypothetical protein L4C38_03615 [Vibrio kasasachensis]|uniref:hypothetical protein n=1 Tax=Vibrio kasasachensis TaxID=2910248 RepID=UPI003D122D8C